MRFHRAVALLDLVEEASHSVWIEARRRQHVHADPIGLGFVRAREVDRMLLGEALRARDHAGEGVAPHVGRRAEQDRGEHRGHRDDAHVLVVVHRACDVPLRHVRDLVREHSGELVLVVRREQQAGVHADIAAGQRERVDLVLFDEEEVKLEIAVVRVARDLAAERADVFG